MSIGGVGSQEYIQQLLFIEGKPLRDLEFRRDDVDARLGILTDVRTRVDAFKKLIADFAEIGSSSAFRQFSVSSSAGDNSSVSISTGSTAVPGTHKLKVNSLAAAHTIASNPVIGGGSTLPVGSHTFRLFVGSGGETADVTVEIEAGDTNATAMDKIVAAIDDTTDLVDASVVTTNTIADQRKLILKSETAGTNGAIVGILDTSGSLMQSLGLQGIGGSFDTVVEASDANFTLDGISIVSDSNEVEGVIEGLTISLLNVSTEEETITVGYDNEAVKGKLMELVDSFNEMMGFLNTKMTSGDETGSGRGELAGDLTFITFRNALVQDLSRSLSEEFAVDGINSLDDVGLSISREGTLTLSDETDFFDALKTSPEGVESFFGSEGGIATRLEDLVKAFTKNGGGLDLSKDLLDSRKDLLEVRITRMERFLELREEQLRDELGRLSVFVAQIGAQQSAVNSILSQTMSLFGGV